MNEVKSFLAMDFSIVVLGIFTGMLAFKAIILAGECIFKFFGIEFKWMREKEEQKKLLAATAESLKTLSEKHEKDTNEMKQHLESFIEETRRENNKLHEIIKQQDEKNKSYREVSREIRDDLKNSVNTLSDGQIERDKQIAILMTAEREVLGDKINQKYKYYLSIKGIPEDEIDEFTNLHAAYKACGGNSSGDAKYDYCINHLEILPVETKLVIKHDTI